MFGLFKLGWYKQLGPTMKSLVDTEELKGRLDALRKQLHLSDSDFVLCLDRSNAFVQVKAWTAYAEAFAREAGVSNTEAAAFSADRLKALFDEYVVQLQGKALHLVRAVLARYDVTHENFQTIEEVIDFYIDLNRGINSSFNVGAYVMGGVVSKVDALLQPEIQKLVKYIKDTYESSI